MSNGDIGTGVINALLSSKHEIVAVYTNQPIEIKKNKIVENDVYKIAKNANLNIKSPKTFKNEDVKAEFLSIEHDIVVVASYGFMLPDYVLTSGKYTAINLHPSSLPKYRGAAPVQRAIENNENCIDVCGIFMTNKLDSGDIIYSAKLYIVESETAGDIFYKINSGIGGIVVLKSLDLIETNTLNPIKQNEKDSTYAKKIEKSELLINPDDDVFTIYNKIRAFTENGYSYIEVAGEKIKILSASYKIVKHSEKIGFIDNDFNIYCNNGFISPKILQKQGKNQVNIKDFLNGWRK